MISHAFWRAIYTSGHDAARMVATREGWLLEGAAAFLLDGEPVGIRYALQFASDWTTRSGEIEGLHGSRSVRHRIDKGADGWRLDGRRMADVDEAVDLDFGFTPATNCPQLRRMALEIGEARAITVAWFDLGQTRLKPLPQHYRRIREDAYAYRSPEGDYQATLLIGANGFVRDYPGLWVADG